MPYQFTYKPNTFSSQIRPENTVVFISNSSGKEKDPETGYHSFGARYYNSDLSLWLSVDPMADKYPNLSPYNYCAWNPMKLVDPDGDSIILSGSQKSIESAINQMNKQSKNLNFSIGDNGRVKCDGRAMSAKERYMKKICNDDKINVSLSCMDHDRISQIYDVSNGGGSFLGNSLSEDKTTVDCFQAVNVNILDKYSNLTNSPGSLIWHEIAEAYEGGRLALATGFSSPNSLSVGSFYDQAHWNAGKFFPGSIIKVISNAPTSIDLPSLDCSKPFVNSKNIKYYPIIRYELHRAKPLDPIYR